MAQVLESICATSKPGTIRSNSGIEVAPDRRISSCVITVMAAAACERGSDFRETDVTCRFIRASMLMADRSREVFPLCCARAQDVQLPVTNVTSKIALRIKSLL